MTDPAQTMMEDGADRSIQEAAAEAGMSVERFVELIEQGLASGEPVDGKAAMARLRHELAFRRSALVSPSG